jgi:hypothetical protein
MYQLALADVGGKNLSELVCQNDGSLAVSAGAVPGSIKIIGVSINKLKQFCRVRWPERLVLLRVF